MSNVNYYSQEGLDELKAELDDMKKVQRPSISKQIAEAREKGDLSENAEYHAAKEAQGLLEARISKLEAVIGSARVLDESKVDTSKVSILCKVKVKNLTMKKEFTYQMVSEKEGDVKTGKISVASPIGKGLLGAKKGEVVDIAVPSGKVFKFEILDIGI